MTASGRATKRGRPRDTDLASGRDRLLAVGRLEFSRRGYAAVSVGDLVRLAEVTSPVLYHHFGSKAGLFIASAEAAYDRTLDRYREAVRDCETFREMIHALIEESARFMREEPTVGMMICTMQFELRRDPALGDALRPRLFEFREFFDRIANAAPESLRPTPQATRDLSHLLVAVAAGTATEALLLTRSEDVDGMFSALQRWAS